MTVGILKLSHVRKQEGGMGLWNKCREFTSRGWMCMTCNNSCTKSIDLKQKRRTTGDTLHNRSIHPLSFTYLRSGHHGSRPFRVFDPDQKPEPTQLALLVAEEQPPHSELNPDVWACHHILEAKPNHTLEFGHLYPQQYPFGHYTKFMTMGEC